MSSRIKEFTNKARPELLAELGRLQTELDILTMKLRQGQSKTSARRAQLRRDVARVKMLLAQPSRTAAST